MSRLILFYKLDKEFKRYNNDLTSIEHDDFNIKVESEKMDAGTRFKIWLIPKTELTIKNVKLIIPIFKGYNRMLVNGYQSWTQSNWKGKHDKIPALNKIAGKLGLSAYGDYRFIKALPRGKYTSHTFTCFKSSSQDSMFFGSLNRENAFTYFIGDLSQQVIEVVADIQDMKIGSPFCLFDLYRSEIDEAQAWEDYSDIYKGSRKPGQKMTGWTSWYQYYTDITEKIILKELSDFYTKNIPIDIFQIDDGYEKKVGDWLSIISEFPRGMKVIADEIREKNIKPGIWLAPFICEKNSQCFKDHPDWILRDTKGKPVVAGYNPGWSGKFYALDIYHLKVQEYLKKVFETVVNDWGYDILKLDFLYAVCLCPPENKTRSMVMETAMTLLHEWCGKAQILACGVPLESAFKRVEYCRIGSDVGPLWEDRKLKKLGYRERVSTRNSLESTLARQSLDQRFFGNDPDVFYLRSEKNDMTEEQNLTLSTLNQILGTVVFTSDSVDRYTDSEMSLYRALFTKQTAKNVTIICDDDAYAIKYNLGQYRFQLFVNLGKENYTIRPADGELFDSSACRFINLVRLGSYESRIFCINRQKEDVQFLGSCSNLPSLSDLKIKIDNNKIEINDERLLPTNTRLCFKSDFFNELFINDEKIIKQPTGYFIYEVISK